MYLTLILPPHSYPLAKNKAFMTCTIINFINNSTLCYTYMKNHFYFKCQIFTVKSLPEEATTPYFLL